MMVRSLVFALALVASVVLATSVGEAASSRHCIQRYCAAEIQACKNTPACMEYMRCFPTRGSFCSISVEGVTPATIAAADAVAQCIVDECPNQ